MEYIHWTRQAKEDKKTPEATQDVKQFPNIAVSLAQEGSLDGGWRATGEQIGIIMDYLTKNTKIGTYYGRTFNIRISGFDGGDFERLS